MKTFICIASGPSLTAEYCQIATQSGNEMIAVNSSWALAPGCQHIYAADYPWWDMYHDSVNTVVRRWTQSRRAHQRYGIELFKPDSGGPFNSGQRAIELAAHLGARRVILLGYDCSLEHGAHWHGEHPKGMQNPREAEVERWHADFASLNESLAGTEIINASRHTALTCFPRMALEKALGFKATDRE